MIQHIQQLLFGTLPAHGNVLKEAKALALAIPLIAQAMVEKSGAKVQIRHQRVGGSTDGKNIWLMDTPLPLNANDQDTFLIFVALRMGLLHHEMGHVNETTFGLQADMDKLTAMIHGIIEDVRQENAHIQRFKHSRKYLDALSLASIHTGLNSPVREDEGLVRVLQGYLLFHLRAKYRNEPHFQPWADQARSILGEQIGLDVVQRMDPILAKMPSLNDTADAVALSKEIVAFLKQELPQQPPSGQSSSQDQDQQHDSSGDAQAENTSTQGANDSQDQQQGPDDDSESNGQSPGQGAEEDASDESDPDSPSAQGSAQDQDQQQDSEGGAEPQSHEDGQEGTGAAANPAKASDSEDSTQPDPPQSSDTSGENGAPSQGNAFTGKSLPANANTGEATESGNGQGTSSSPNATGQNPLKDHVAQAIQKLLDGADLDVPEGDLDDMIRQALNQLQQDMAASGDFRFVPLDLGSMKAADAGFESRVYQSPAEYDFTDAMSVVGKLRTLLKRRLVTLSETKTSRGRHGQRIDNRVIHRAFLGDPRVFRSVNEGIRLDTSVVLLCDVSGSMQEENRIQMACAAMYATACALQAIPDIEVAAAAFPEKQLVMPFHGRANRERERFCLRADGGTPLHEGLLMAQRLLSHRTAQRKVVFVMTDGRPDDVDLATQHIYMLEKSGVDVIGLGIQADFGKAFFGKWVIVEDVHSLPEAMLSMLGHHLNQRLVA